MTAPVDELREALTWLLGGDPADPTSISAPISARPLVNVWCGGTPRCRLGSVYLPPSGRPLFYGRNRAKFYTGDRGTEGNVATTVVQATAWLDLDEVVPVSCRHGQPGSGLLGLVGLRGLVADVQRGAARRPADYVNP